MELWQKQHINRNISDLLETTKCNVQLVSSLRAAGILSQFEEENLTCSQLLPQEKARTLYDILVTRSESYHVLIECLQTTSQTGAVRILQQSTTTLGHYGLISYDKGQLLGRGRPGTMVYKGKFENRDVAVKVLHSALISAEEAKQEVEFLQKLDHHKNIIRFYMAEQQKDLFVIALELCSITLEEQIRKKPIQIEMKTVLKKCTKGLAHLHKLNVLHRDIKPTNILLTEAKQVKLSDFGLSKYLEDRSLSGVTASRVFGTMGWTAPEVTPKTDDETILGKMTLKCDIFSLGCVFWYSLSNGLHPFGDGHERSYNIINGKSKDWPTNTAIRTKWRDVVISMISINPEDRPSADTILSTLWCNSAIYTDLNNNELEVPKALDKPNIKTKIPTKKHLVTQSTISSKGKNFKTESKAPCVKSSANQNAVSLKVTKIYEAVSHNKLASVKQAIQKFEMLLASRETVERPKSLNLHSSIITQCNQESPVKSPSDQTLPRVLKPKLTINTSASVDEGGLHITHDELFHSPRFQRSFSTPANLAESTPLNAWTASRFGYDIVRCLLVGDYTTHIEEIFNCFYLASRPKRHFTEHFCREKRIFFPMEVDDKTVIIELEFVYAGLKRYDKYRVGTKLPDAHVFLLCFSLVYPASFETVVENRYPELCRYYPKAPFVLVGTQLHLRTNRTTIRELQVENESPISYEMGKRMAEKIYADSYVECSAITKEGLDDVLSEAVRAFWRDKEKSRNPKKQWRYRKKA